MQLRGHVCGYMSQTDRPCQAISVCIGVHLTALEYLNNNGNSIGKVQRAVAVVVVTFSYFLFLLWLNMLGKCHDMLSGKVASFVFS